MENQQQQPSATTLCRSGCGFFGSTATEGLCSKCYKDSIKRKQDTARLSPTMPLPSSSTVASPIIAAAVAASSDVTPLSPTSTSSSNAAASAQSCAQAALATEEVTAKLESAVAKAEAESSIAEASTAPATASAVPPKKANRCHCCNKRVGLTGFTCRCGGLYCSEHRYDNAHGCTFDYKTMEREELRKNNPVVVSDKIQRI